VCENLPDSEPQRNSEHNPERRGVRIQVGLQANPFDGPRKDAGRFRLRRQHVLAPHDLPCGPVRPPTSRICLGLTFLYLALGEWLGVPLRGSYVPSPLLRAVRGGIPPTTGNTWLGRPDLNRRPLAPKASALPDCATSRPAKAPEV
jgi:hypothetical protein